MDLFRGFVQSIFHAPESQPNLNPGAGRILPPELFFHILYHLSHYDHRAEVYERYKAKLALGRAEDMLEYFAERAKAGPKFGLKNCSLVCRYWANQCRRYMFRGATIHIRSYDDAEAFRKYTTGGSLRLIRLCRLAASISVTQHYSSPRSFLHLIHTPLTEKKLGELHLRGPIPSGFPPSQRKTPHFGTANIAVWPPNATSYRTVRIFNIELPSFKQVAKYIEHFKDTQTLSFNALTWTGNVVQPIPHHTNTAKTARLRVEISARKCTNDLFVCWQAAMMHCNFALRTVPDRDQFWALNMMTYIYNHYRDVPCRDPQEDGIVYTLMGSISTDKRRSSFSFSVNDVRWDFPRASILFVIRPELRTPSPSSARRSSPTPIRIVGVMVIVYAARPTPSSPNTFNTVDLAILRAEIEQRCALRVVVFAFENYATLLALTQRNPALSEPFTTGHTYRFACRRTEEHAFTEVPGGNGRSNRTWVAIEPTTLQTTGEQWTNLQEIVPRLLR